jgi:hypothetical protein
VGTIAFNNQCMTTRTSQNEMTDILVWELVNVRCALAQRVDDDERRRLRKREKSLVGALLDMGVLSAQAIAPLPPLVADVPQATY